MSERFLTDRHALVTGASSGIGLAIAQALAGAGARVSYNGLGSDAQIAAASASIASRGAGGVHYSPADLRDPAAITAWVSDSQAIAPIDIVVNSAGVQYTASLAEMPAERWDALIAINLSAAFHTMRLALPGMAERGYGRVLNIASVHGLVASVQKAPYVASKFGLIGLSRVAALEHAAAGTRATGGVTVNCLCPGWVETPLIEPQIMARAASVGGDRDQGIREMLREKQPSQRTSLPEEIAATALWLCRKESHNLTGAALPIDGGWTSQ
ncbi:MAG: 3-hydroxybutyrate dehydrogenase [Lysobacteraceae bacterium]